ncbi:MAG: protein kinase, partial [Actinomycetota bacterium]|nr:protein kinase [Actinomycetota bacterium]
MVGAGGLLGGRYRLEETIAAGGMGTVFAATDERLHRRVAVKVLKEHLATDPKFVERFGREARAAAALSHPNVATVFDFGEDDGTPFIVMEMAPGRDLARVLREEGPLAPERARGIAAQICAALGHAHAAGLVHRDVKPANVIVDDGDRVKVTDFGIARATGDSTLTAAGSVLGSAHYISPEQASGASVTPATDVYSAGIVLYEMLTKTLPFTADSALAVALRHVSDEVPAPSLVNPDVPASLDEIVARATAKDPAARWATAGAMAAALGRDRDDTPAPIGAQRRATGPEATQVIGPEGTTAATSVWPIPGERYDPRRLGIAVLAGAGLLAFLAAAVWVWLLTKPDEPDPTTARREPRREVVATEPAGSTSHAYELEDFTGQSFKDAEKALEEHGLTAVPVEEPSEEPKDEVLRSEPPPGTPMTPGETVTLIVSTGKLDE